MHRFRFNLLTLFGGRGSKRRRRSPITAYVYGDGPGNQAVLDFPDSKGYTKNVVELLFQKWSSSPVSYTHCDG